MKSKFITRTRSSFKAGKKEQTLLIESEKGSEVDPIDLTVL